MYTLITGFLDFLYEKKIFKSSEFDIPIINVGNLSVGGSGKTPHIEYLVRLLKNEFNVAVLSRGYGRKTRGFREVFENSKSTESGDEPLQIKNKFPEIKVFVGEKRVEAITALLFDNPQIDVILLDDAYQHRAIKAGYNILLTDYSKIFTRDISMPFGRLREKPQAAKRSDIVVVTKCKNDILSNEKDQLKAEICRYTDSPIIFSSVLYDDFILFNDIIGEMPINPNILLVSGLANPEPMYEYLSKEYVGSEIKHLEFRDHHNFSKKNIKYIIDEFYNFECGNKIVVISEKDAVRLKSMDLGKEFEELPVFVLPIRIDFENSDKEKFNNNILTYVRENKADYSIHTD